MDILPQRSHPRLKGFDYSHGWYFVTICTDKRKRILSRISVGRGALTPPCVELSDIGRTIEKHIFRTNDIYPNVSINTFVIMPNHVHLIVAIEPAADGGVRAPRPTTLSDIVRSIKAMVTREFGPYGKHPFTTTSSATRQIISASGNTSTIIPPTGRRTSIILNYDKEDIPCLKKCIPSLLSL